LAKRAAFTSRAPLTFRTADFSALQFYWTALAIYAFFFTNLAAAFFSSATKFCVLAAVAAAAFVVRITFI